MKRTYILAGTLIAALIFYYFFVYNRDVSSLDSDDISFAVKDTGAVKTIALTKVIEGEDIERIILDRRPNGTWQLDKKYPVFQPRINYLLKTMHLIHVKEKLVDEGIKTAQHILDLTHTRVEIYDEKGLVKAYLLGTEAKGSRGTLMKLENSRQPFIVELPGLQGFVNTHYTLDRTVWRENLLFDGHRDKIKNISLTYPEAGKSFRLQRESPEGTWQILGNETALHTKNLEKYLSQFDRKIYAESFAEEAYPGKLEELQGKTPSLSFSIGYFTGEIRTIHLFEREENPNNYFGWVEGVNELLTIQHFVFDKFREERSFFVERVFE
ncbi:MAG: hypothetical protein SF052_02115 [Bacteroidia bacterium]|nr:hypothetical protein [Bacteroidia bacterium]